MLNKNRLIMKEKREIKMLLTSSEEELISAIRNYVETYPNGHPRLLEYAQDVFDRLTLID